MIFDCDIHNSSPMEVVLDYLDEPYRSEVARFGFRKLFPGIRWEDGGSRADATAPGRPAWRLRSGLDRGRPPGTGAASRARCCRTIRGR